MIDFVVLANPVAGSSSRDTLGRALTSLAAVGTVRLYELTRDVRLADVLGAGRRCVIAGGDGTVHRVVNAAHRAGVLDQATFAILPLGTGNDLARALGLSLDPLEAADLATSAEVATLDLAHVRAGGQERLVANAVHMGLGVTAANVAGRVKRALGPGAYPVGAIAAGLLGRSPRVTVVADGAEVAAGAMAVVSVGIGRSTGGGTELHPTSEPTDRALDVTAVADPTRRGRAGLAYDLARSRHLDRPDVSHREAARVRLEGHDLTAVADGERIELGDRVDIEVMLHAWRVVVPGASSSDGGQDPRREPVGDRPASSAG